MVRSGFHVITVIRIRRKNPIENRQSGVRLLTYRARKYLKTRNTEKQQNFILTIQRFHFGRHDSTINFFVFAFHFFCWIFETYLIINVKTLCANNSASSYVFSCYPGARVFRMSREDRYAQIKKIIEVHAGRRYYNRAKICRR